MPKFDYRDLNTRQPHSKLVEKYGEEKLPSLYYLTAMRARMAHVTARYECDYTKKIVIVQEKAPNISWIVIYPDIAMASIAYSCTGAYRAWQLANSIDFDGSGKISLRALIDLGRKLDINRSTINSWVRNAIDIGFFEHRTYAPNDIVYMSGVARVRKMLKINAVGRPMRRTKIPINKFVDSSWRSYAYAGYVVSAGWNGKLISQERKSKILGISERTIRKYEKLLTPVRNFAVIDLGRTAYQGDLEYYREFHQGAYYLSNGHLIKCLPNSVYVDISRQAAIVVGPAQKTKHRRGSEILPFPGEVRTSVSTSPGRKNNLFLRRQDNSISKMPKLFFSSYKTAKFALRKIIRTSTQKYQSISDSRAQLFYPALPSNSYKRNKGMRFWSAIQIDG